METITTIEADFIAALQKEPRNLETLEVYADWLESNVETDKANALRLKKMLLVFGESFGRVDTKWLSEVGEVIEVKCPECKSTAGAVGAASAGAAAVRVVGAPAVAFCYQCNKYFDFTYIIGNKYKDRYGIYLWMGGLGGKWWTKVE